VWAKLQQAYTVPISPVLPSSIARKLKKALQIGLIRSNQGTPLNRKSQDYQPLKMKDAVSQLYL